MPAIAVGAIVLGGMEVATVGAAVLAGTATLAETFAVVGAIGAIAGGVGSLTGNPTLTKVGMVLGAVGGIGALAAGAGVIGGTASVTTGEGAAMSGAGGAVGSVADTSAIASGAAALPDAAGGIDIGGAETGNVASVASPAAGNAPTGGIDAGGAETGNVPSPSAPSGMINTPAPGAAPAATPPGGVFDSVMKGGKSVLDLVNGNKGVANILGQLGAGALAGLNPKTQAETEYLKSQTALNQQRMATLGAPMPALASATGTRPSVYPGGVAPTYVQPNVTGSVTGNGLINSGVTGAVA